MTLKIAAQIVIAHQKEDMNPELAREENQLRTNFRNPGKRFKEILAGSNLIMGKATNLLCLDFHDTFSSKSKVKRPTKINKESPIRQNQLRCRLSRK
ncbi:hypothetical protein ACLMJK_003836 [Lecanora helva]